MVYYLHFCCQNKIPWQKVTRKKVDFWALAPKEESITVWEAQQSLTVTGLWDTSSQPHTQVAERELSKVMTFKAPPVEYFLQQASTFCFITSSKHLHQLGTKCSNICGHVGHFSSSHIRYLLLRFASGENVTLNVILLCEWTISPFQGFLNMEWTRSCWNIKGSIVFGWDRR